MAKLGDWYPYIVVVAVLVLASMAMRRRQVAVVDLEEGRGGHGQFWKSAVAFNPPALTCLHRTKLSLKFSSSFFNIEKKILFIRKNIKTELKFLENCVSLNKLQV